MKRSTRLEEDRRHHRRHRRACVSRPTSSPSRGRRGGACRRAGPGLRRRRERGGNLAQRSARRQGDQGLISTGRARRAGNGPRRPGRRDHDRGRRLDHARDPHHGEISTASSEQSAGVAQVSEACRDGPGNAQNAALVEQSAAAATGSRRSRPARRRSLGLHPAPRARGRARTVPAVPASPAAAHGRRRAAWRRRRPTSSVRLRRTGRASRRRPGRPALRVVLTRSFRPHRTRITPCKRPLLPSPRPRSPRRRSRGQLLARVLAFKLGE